MKDSGGERIHYPYGECILSPTDFDVGSTLDSFGAVLVVSILMMPIMLLTVLGVGCFGSANLKSSALICCSIGSVVGVINEVTVIVKYRSSSYNLTLTF